MNAKVAKTLNAIIGTFPFISATIGAIIVAILAKKLQIPMAVAQKSVGNKELWAMYTRLKVEATAKEALSTKAGNTRGEVAEYPNAIII